MSGDTGVVVFCCVAVLTMGGCLFGMSREEEITKREREKTEQIKVQAKIDSLKIVSNTKEGL